MMADKTHGLVLGKFAPLHKGHQLLIETAISEMDKVTVVIYDASETTFTPLNIRASWIKHLYPYINIIEAWDGPVEVGDTPVIKQSHEQYIARILNEAKITHFYSSEFYGEHMSRSLGAIKRDIDCQRVIVPISGTQIRGNPHKHKYYLDPIVYRDLIISVVFLGAPSTGKTTIAQVLSQKYETAWMPEYGREYWEEHQVNRRLNLGQLVEIAEGHLQREEILLQQSNNYLFVDTNALTTNIFASYYHNKTSRKLVELANQAASRYDLVFVCDVDIPYDNTWDRSGDVNRLVFQKQIIADLKTRKIPFFILSGDIDTRTKSVASILARYNKYQNLAKLFMSTEELR